MQSKAFTPNSGSIEADDITINSSRVRMWQRPLNLSSRRLPRSSRGDNDALMRNRTKERLIPAEYNPQNLTIKDHDGNDVNLAWCPKCYDCEPPEKLPPFPFQVYITHGAKTTLQNVTDFAERFASFIEWIGGISNNTGVCPDELCIDEWCHHRDNAGCSQYRFDVYNKPFTNVLACIAHQRREIRHRSRNGIWPQLVRKWSIDDLLDGYKGKIIVIDRDDWEESGPILALFDPVQYEHPHQYTSWSTAGDGDYSIVEARRITSKDMLRVRFRTWWVDAGHEWTEADLRRRNEGGFSPVLYPAVDPAAHLDAEHEVFELDGTASLDPGVQPNSLHPVTGERIVDRFDKDELFQCENLMRHLKTESYSDSFGLPVTSIWDPGLSTLRPPFCMTLYISFDTLPVDSKALFSCLNKGLISKEAWTLDVVRNMPSIDAAYEYHSRAFSRRRRTKVLETEACMEMLIRKLIGNRLPTELVEYIKELLVPPEIPDYSSRPTRAFRNTFIYLDAKSMLTGPLLVYSDLAPFRQQECSAKKGILPSSPWFPAHMIMSTCQIPLLRAFNLRYWHRVADEIHILKSFCGPRSEAMGDRDMPRITFILRLPDELQWKDLLSELNTLPFELHASQPITIPMQSVFSHYWDEAFEIIDLETGNPLAGLPHKILDPILCFDSWSQALELGFKNVPYLKTIQPGPLENGWTHRIPRFTQAWEDLSPQKGLLVKGQKYALRLKEDVTVPRWIYGTVEQRQGPFNLPPILVKMSEDSQLIFRYAGP